MIQYESKIKLAKVSSSHSRLRTEEVIGYVKKVPVIGSNFIMAAPPLDKSKDFRWIETSHIKSIEYTSENFLTFETENSVYNIEVLED